MVQRPLPQHPLLMKSARRRKDVAKRVKSMSEEELASISNWWNVNELGQSARLNLIDLDDEEIFEPKKGHFECLATLYVTLFWPEDIEFEETFSATFHGKINGEVAVESADIDTSSFTGESLE